MVSVKLLLVSVACAVVTSSHATLVVSLPGFSSDEVAAVRAAVKEGLNASEAGSAWSVAATGEQSASELALAAADMLRAKAGAAVPALCASLDVDAAEASCPGSRDWALVHAAPSGSLAVPAGLGSAEALATAASTVTDLVGASDKGVCGSSKAMAAVCHELHLFASLPAWMHKDKTPELAVLSLSAFLSVPASQRAAAMQLLTRAAPRVVARWREGDVVVAPEKMGAVAAMATARRLLATAGAGAQAGFTTAQISEYQTFLWTAFLLALAVIAAVAALCNMDFGEDDGGLYSKFKQGDKKMREGKTD